MEEPIRMVDLINQLRPIREEIDQALARIMEEASFVQGPYVNEFASQLSDYLGGAEVIPCANGTDALQIALMALDLLPGDEVIVPAFTYVATAEVIALLRLRPVLVDVDPRTFNTTAAHLEAAITPRTKAMVPVHLFGQCCNMEEILALSDATGIPVIEDAAQSLGSQFHFSDGRRQPAGTLGVIGCTSFFPSKNLGAFGDGGAMFTREAEYADALRMIANHGQSQRYYHDRVGVNSRLDAMQAAILSVKLRHLDRYNAARRAAADYYDEAFSATEALLPPFRAAFSDHVFHQYTLQVQDGRRDALKAHLDQLGIPAMIYYPVPLHHQKAFQSTLLQPAALSTTEELCQKVISLPMHSELHPAMQDRIIEAVLSFF